MKNINGNKRIILVSDFTANSGVGIQARLWTTQLIEMGFRIIVVCGKSDELQGNSVRVVNVAPMLPYSFRVFIITLSGFFLGLFRRPIDSFEILTRNTSILQLHSDCFDPSKLDGVQNHRRIFRKLATSLQKLAFLRAVRIGSTIIVPSESLAERLRKKQSKAKFEVLPNALDSLDPVVIESIKLNVAKIGPLRLKKHPLRIGFVAQGDLIYKGLVDVIHFLSESEKVVVLEIAGLTQPPSIEAIENLSVFWKGNMNRYDYVNWLKSIDGVVIGSRYESFSMVAFEACLLGLPVLALGEIGLSEYYDGNLLSRSISDSGKFFSQASSTNKSDLNNSDFLDKRYAKIDKILGK